MYIRFFLFIFLFYVPQILFASPRYSLITTLYNEKDPARIQEYLTCLETNLKHTLIDDIHIIYDFAKDNEENFLLKELEKLPITIHFHNGRPTNGFCFHLAHSVCKYRRIIICNADIYFNDTLNILNSFDLAGKFLGLTRWDVKSDGSLELFKQYYPDGSFWEYSSATSQDAWIFQTPLPVFQNDKIPLGTMTCDSFIAYQAAQAGLVMVNPCLSVQACHLHLSNIRNYDPRINQGPVAPIYWSSIIPDETNDLPPLLSSPFFSYPSRKNPRVSLITSLFNGEEFIQDFMKNIVEQSIFSMTECIIINANSPSNEEKFILPYLKKYSNISYMRLSQDPGLYAVWNMGIRYASAPLIGNANLDDRRELYSLEKQVKKLEKHPEFDLAYCDFCATDKPNPQWYDLTGYARTTILPFTKAAIYYCLPGPQPVWRKSMHEKSGYFREDFISAGDQEMWCRAVHFGSQFVKVNWYSGIYYVNPKGISTDPDNVKATRRTLENGYIAQTYKHLWS